MPNDPKKPTDAEEPLHVRLPDGVEAPKDLVPPDLRDAAAHAELAKAELLSRAAEVRAARAATANKISNAPPPVEPLAGRGRQTTPDPLPSQQYGQSRAETVRQTITRVIQESEMPPTTGTSNPAGPLLSPAVQASADKAVLGICEMLGLLFGLPFGEDLYHGTPVTNAHIAYLVVGIIFAGVGPMWPHMRTLRWISPSIAASISRAAYDARLWVLVLLSIFFYGVAPEIYRRAIEPPASSNGYTQQQVDEKIANAVASLNTQLAEANRQKDAAHRDADALRRQLQNTPAPLPQHYDEPKIYTNKTIADLQAFYKDRTALQAAAFMADEIGKWINTEGKIQFIRPDGLVFLNVEGGIVSCEFSASWNQKLSAFRSGELMKVTGKIGTGQIGASPIYLRPCELRD